MVKERVKNNFRASAKRGSQAQATGVDMHTALFPMNVLVRCVGIWIESFQSSVMDYMFAPCEAKYVYIFIYLCLFI